MVKKGLNIGNIESLAFSSHRMGAINILSRSWKTLSGLVIPIAFLPLALSLHTEARCAYVLLVMAFYWMLEPMHLAATALLPVALFPLLGIMSTEEACAPYMKATNMMFLGGLLMAIAIESCGLHKRIALKVLLWVGTSLRRIMLGIMLTTTFLSMWISNTAATAMMIPIVDAMLEELKNHSNREGRQPQSQKEQAVNVNVDDSFDEKEKREKTHQTVRKTLLLSIAYSANIGGTGTLTGTGTNLVLQGIMDESYPDSKELTFSSWFIYAAPGMVICVFLAWILLHFLFIRNYTSDSQNGAIRSMFMKKYEELGSMSFHEKAVSVLFLILVLLWLFREPKFIPGWADIFTHHKQIKDATPAIVVAALMFIIPASWDQFYDPNKQFFKTKTLLEWPTVQKKLPWGVVLLLGGGLALAEGTKASGLSKLMVDHISYLYTYSPRQAMLLLCLIAAFVTEVTSNVATAAVILPVINDIAVAMKVHPLLLLLPVTLCVSFAFMLPVATPPNALVFETLGLKPMEMIKPGLVMNILCIGVELVVINTWGVLVFDLNEFPSWAQKEEESSRTVGIEDTFIEQKKFELMYKNCWAKSCKLLVRYYVRSFTNMLR